MTSKRETSRDQIAMNWWIVEDALTDRTGHWIEYLSTFQHDLHAIGDDVNFFCDREAQPFVIQNFSANAILPPSIWHKMSERVSRWKRLLWIFSHGVTTWKVMRAFLKKEQAPDVIFVPTVLVHHLVGWSLLLRLLPDKTRLLLFFPNTPIVYDTQNQSPKLSPDPTAKLFSWLVGRMKPFVESGQLILGAETHSMRSAMTSVLDVPFTYFPHPVKDHKSAIPQKEKPLTFGCYGAARFEKGNDLLQLAIAQHLQQTNSDSNFAVQWISDFKDKNGNLIQKDPVLLQDQRVQFITEYFPEGGYATQMSRTDIMILPYREPYRYRVSRVAIEAMVHGMPIIASRGTTIFEQASRYGTVVGCELGSVDSVIAAIEYVEQNQHELIAEAKAKSTAVSNHFSVNEFRNKLVTYPI